MHAHASEDPEPDVVDAALLDGLAAAFSGERPTPVARPSLRELAGFRILREIGTGGMGVVYEAMQSHPKRRVALKVARESYRRSIIDRFEYETHLLGRLQHPSIAEIFEAGNCEVPGVGEVSYFAMALIEDACPITAYALSRDLPVEDRIRLFIQALEGVEHGHQRGVVHRDLKPSNLLVDSHGQVKVIDFGLARTISTDDELKSMHTLSGQLLGTPQYMSPEQWRDPTDVDPQTDVYSMGVVLFELLTGGLPYDFAGKAMLEIGEAVRREPASHLALDSAGPRSDLDVIVQKALEKDRADRYGSAAAFLSDLRRYLKNEPIAARPPSTWYQVRKFARRNRGLVAAVAVVLLVSIVGAIVSTSFAFAAMRRGDMLESRLYAANMGRLYHAYEKGNITRVREFLATVPVSRRHWEWRRLNALVRDRSLRTIRDPDLATTPIPERQVNRLAPSPDGTRALAAGTDGKLRTWDLSSGELLRVDAAHSAPVFAVAWSPSGDRILSGDHAGIVQLRDAESGALIEQILAGFDARDPTAKPSRVSSVRFGPGPDRITVVVGHPQFLARVFDTEGQQLFESPRPSAGSGLSVPRPGTDDSVYIGIRLFTGIGTSEKPSMTMMRDASPIALAFSGDGRLAVFGCRNKAVQLWDVQQRRKRWSVLGHHGSVLAVAFSPGGSVIATGGDDHTIKLWRVDTKQPEMIAALHGHAGEVHTLHFLADGTLLSSAADQTIKIWPAGKDPLDVTVELPTRGLAEVAFDSGGRRLVVAANPGKSAVVDLQSQQVITSITNDRYIRSAALRPGRRNEFAVASDRRVVAICSAETAATRLEISGPKYFASVAYDSTGERLAACDFAGRVGVWDADDGSEIWVRPILDTALFALAFSPDDKWIAAGGNRGTLVVLHAADGVVAWRDAHSDRVQDLAFHPGGRHLVTAGRDGVVREFRTDGNGQPKEFPGLAGPATSVAYSPDGERLFVGYATGIVKLWSRAGEELCAIRCFQNSVRSLAVSPDGETVAVVGDERKLRLWKTTASR